MRKRFKYLDDCYECFPRTMSNLKTGNLLTVNDMKMSNVISIFDGFIDVAFIVLATAVIAGTAGYFFG